MKTMQRKVHKTNPKSKLKSKNLTNWNKKYKKIQDKKLLKRLIKMLVIIKWTQNWVAKTIIT